MSGVDWGIGRYEPTARALEPAAEAVVAHAAPGPGERVLDVGCGTGNAALLAAGRGAVVTGVDPAARLLEVARERAVARGLEATFAAGEAASLPVEDGSADLVLSVFAVIFAPDPRAAAAEMARVTAPGGRIVLSAWEPSGTVHEAMGLAGAATRAALGAPEPSQFAWHDRATLQELFAPHGFAVGLERRTLAFAADSPRAYLDEQDGHPLAVVADAVLGPRGESEALRARMLAVLEQGNEDPAAFRATSRYVIATARPAGTDPSAAADV